MRIFLVSLLLVIASGCRTPKGPSKDWTGVVRILPVIVSNSEGKTNWTREDLVNGIQDTNLYWSYTAYR